MYLMEIENYNSCQGNIYIFLPRYPKLIWRAQVRCNKVSTKNISPNKIKEYKSPK